MVLQRFREEEADPLLLLSPPRYGARDWDKCRLGAKEITQSLMLCQRDNFFSHLVYGPIVAVLHGTAYLP